MDITSFVMSSRNTALIYGDYDTYHVQLSRRILRCRQKLGIASKHRAKYTKKLDVTAEDVGRDVSFLHLLLLTSERGWAHAMSMKASHAASSKALGGRTRSHIISRLVKSARVADHLVAVLSQTAESGAAAEDVLEARAYAALMHGAAAFEKQSWQPCLEHYSVSRTIYGSLSGSSPSSSAKTDLFRDLLSDTIDPSIRYAAYQLKTPRTVPIPTIAKEQFTHHADAAVVDAIRELDPDALGTTSEIAAGDSKTQQTLTWRSREVKIEDAAIAQAWTATDAAKGRLRQKYATMARATPRRLAAAYDEVLAATQEAADATKRAIDELREEGVSTSDARVQSLQVTRTAVNYEMISWRIGRNRVLVGPQDGAVDDSSLRRKPKASSDDMDVDQDARSITKSGDNSREEKPRIRLIRLKEKTALYDGTLQNIEAVTELAGVAADEGLMVMLEATRKYFEALKCLAVGRSHAIVANFANALALLNHASALLDAALPVLDNSDAAVKGPPHIDVSAESARALQTILRGELERYRALTFVERLREESKQSIASRAAFQPPLIDQLNDFPEVVDLARIVELPPRLASIPAKPILLDCAWNFLDYPRPEGKQKQSSAQASGSTADAVAGKPAEQPQRKGWFGFGR